jgi:tetratricopeptide (TPR) repeat protein
MVNKENILFGIVGLLGGLIIGFMVANSINQSQPPAVSSSATMTANGLPSGHPPTGGDAGSIPEVQAAIEKARSEPENYDAQIKAAELFYQIQRFEGAVEFLEKAAKLKPEDHSTQVNLGNAYFDSGRYEQAEKTYTAILAKKPDDVDVRTDLGLTFAARPQADYDRAIAEFERVLAKNPTHTLALQNLIVAYTKKGDAAKATTTLAKLEAADSTNASIAKLREEIGKISKN